MQKELRAMRHTTWVAALLVAANVGGARPARAQPLPSSPQDNCEPSRVRALTASTVGPRWAPHLPQVILDKNAAAIARRDYAAAIGAIINDADTVLANRPNPAHDAYKRRLTALNEAIALFVQQPPQLQPDFMASTVKAADFQLNENPVTGNYPLFAGTPDAVTVTSAMTPDVQRALCWPVIAIDNVLTAVGASWRASTVANLTALASRWDHFIGDGLSQFPWELAVNSALYKRASFEPPGAQVVLLHPSIGADVGGHDLKSLQRTDALVLEALGAIWYNYDHSRYWGASAVTTLASGRNASAGFYAHLWWPEMMAGYVWRSDTLASRRQSFVVSLDLYKFLSGVPSRLQDARDTALGRKLLSLRP